MHRMIEMAFPNPLLLLLLLLLLLIFPSLVTSISWSPLSCPHAGSPFTSCSEPSFATDVAVTLFFQIESTGNSGGEFSCVITGANKAILCARNWTQTESGSAGSCFFLLPQGQSYSCSASGGQINVIDADSTPLENGSLKSDAPPFATTCPGTQTLDVSSSASSSCTAPAQANDVWVSMGWTSIATNQASSFECTIDNVLVCAYGAAYTGKIDSSSCSFLVPAQAELVCTATSGATSFLGSNAIATFNAPYAATGFPSAGVACPPAHVNVTNDCDCEFAALPTADVLVQIVSTSIDAGFNSFHCFIDGANVCGWGSNTGMNNSLGSCTFIVPAGGSGYGCTMEWGAASFPSTTVTLMSRGTFSTSVEDKASVVLVGSSINKASAVGLNDDRGTSSLSSSSSVDRGTSSLSRRKNDSSSFSSSTIRASTTLSSVKQVYSFPKAPAPLAIDQARIDRLWREWRVGRPQYASKEEEDERRANFVQHVAYADNVRHKIRDHPHLDEDGLQNHFNHFADWTRKEWESIYRKKMKKTTSDDLLQSTLDTSAREGIPPPPPAPPAPFDYADKGVVTPVKDQQQCGSCWSFSTTGSIESAWTIAGNPLVSLSEQYLVSCDTTSDGCDGGWPYSAIDFLASTGAITEASYPYVSGNGSSMPCSTNGRVFAEANVTGYQPVAGNTSQEREDVLADWLAEYSPVSILVDDMTQLWWTYVGGVMTACCDIATNHAVLLTGYDYNSTSNLSYWKIKNSVSYQNCLGVALCVCRRPVCRRRVVVVSPSCNVLFSFYYCSSPVPPRLVFYFLTPVRMSLFINLH